MYLRLLMVVSSCAMAARLAVSISSPTAAISPSSPMRPRNCSVSRSCSARYSAASFSNSARHVPIRAASQGSSRERSRVSIFRICATAPHDRDAELQDIGFHEGVVQLQGRLRRRFVRRWIGAGAGGAAGGEGTGASGGLGAATVAAATGGWSTGAVPSFRQAGRAVAEKDGQLVAYTNVHNGDREDEQDHGDGSTFRVLRLPGKYRLRKMPGNGRYTPSPSGRWSG